MNFIFRKSLFCALAFVSLAFFTQNAFAAFYKYIDEKGIIHLTNNVKNIPEKMRQGAKVLEESGEMVREKLIDGKYVLGEARATFAEVQLEAEKLWWRWIVDPESGKTRAPVIIGGYLLISLITFAGIRNHLHGRTRKLLLKFLFMGFVAIGVLMYSAHRGHQTYIKYKDSSAEIEKLLGMDMERFLRRE
ncbi:MAG: hypothetical protein RQ824_02320 [bacterium]|nr:hypothetical protein [bacterium]